MQPIEVDTGYDHTQRSPLGWLLGLLGVVMSVTGLTIARSEPLATVILVVAGVVVCLLGGMFAHLRVVDDRDQLRLRYGPIPLFGKQIPFASMTSARIARSRLIDGWGIHFFPGRGWTYNLWGFDCVELTVAGQTVRVGTDDPTGLLACIQQHGVGDS